jgi:hypothetical protein
VGGGVGKVKTGGLGGDVSAGAEDDRTGAKELVLACVDAQENKAVRTAVEMIVFLRIDASIGSFYGNAFRCQLS